MIIQRRIRHPQKKKEKRKSSLIGTLFWDLKKKLDIKLLNRKKTKKKARKGKVEERRGEKDEEKEEKRTA